MTLGDYQPPLIITPCPSSSVSGQNFTGVPRWHFFQRGNQITEERKKQRGRHADKKFFPSITFSQIFSTEDMNEKISPSVFFCITEALVARLSSGAPIIFHRGGSLGQLKLSCVVAVLSCFVTV